MYMVSLLSILPFTAPACGSAQGGGEAPEAPKVYFVRDITPENMVRLYEALERPATGKVAVKLSTGEPGGHNFLKPELIKDLVQKVDDTIVECNTAYGGGRASTESHLKAAADHGFTAIAPVDIMDAEGEVSLPVKGGRHLRENFVGSHYPAYDFTVVALALQGARHGRLRRCGEEHLDRHRLVGGQGVDTFGREDARMPPRCGATCPRRTIFWSRWPRQPSRWQTICGEKHTATST